MAAVNTISELTGLFKRRYANRLERLIPEEYVLQNLIAFNRAKKLGDTFHQPVVLQREQGVTYAASGDGAFYLDAAIAGQVKDAQVQGSQCVIRGAIDYESLAKGEGEGEHSFNDSNSLLLENITLSLRQRLEISLWYGQDELGLVASIATNTITITTAEWAPGIWSGMEGAKVEIFDSAGTTLRGSATIASVDIPNKQITLDAAPAGVTGTDRIFFKTARTISAHKDMAGMHTIATNAGTLFNISASTYSLWKSCTFAVGGNFSFEAAQDGGALVMGKGGKGQYTVFVSAATWAKMMTDQAALRRHSDPNKSSAYEMGAESITFFWQGGRMDIVSSIIVKEGYAYMLQPALFQRIGATDVTFNVPGRGGDFYRQLDDQAGIEVRAFYHQALFSKAPGKLCLFTGIANT